MCFETVYIAVLIKVPFEFTRFFKLQNIVKNRIHFNTSYRGAYSQMYFFLKGKNWGGLIKGGGLLKGGTSIPGG